MLKQQKKPTKESVRKQKRDASKLMHDIQKRASDIDKLAGNDILDYCLCCGADLPKSHFLYPRE